MSEKKALLIKVGERKTPPEKRGYGIELVDIPVVATYDAIFLCAAHEDFKAKGFAWVASLGKESSIMYDVKIWLPVGLIDGRL